VLTYFIFFVCFLPPPFPGSERNAAAKALSCFGSSPDYIPQCQHILDNSQQPYALYLASSSLTKLVTAHWNAFTVAQRLDTRNYVLSHLASRGPGLPPFVATSLVHLATRITRLAWHDCDAHRLIVDDCGKFLRASLVHALLGLQILASLTDEINQPVTARSLTQHRKTAVSFR
jgi:exportin-7